MNNGYIYYTYTQGSGKVVGPVHSKTAQLERERERERVGFGEFASKGS